VAPVSAVSFAAGTGKVQVIVVRVKSSRARRDKWFRGSPLGADPRV